MSLQNLKNYPHDGVQGLIYNDTPNLIAVSLASYDVVVADLKFQPSRFTYQTALLLPGDSMSYQLQSVDHLEVCDFLSFWKPSELSSIYNPNGNDPGWAERAQLALYDGTFGWPTTYFIPPGGNYIDGDPWELRRGHHTGPLNKRTGISQGQSNEEIWGSVHLSVKRENDGWQIPTSQAYLDRYPNPNHPSTSDWAIFTTRIKSL